MSVRHGFDRTTTVPFASLVLLAGALHCSSSGGTEAGAPAGMELSAEGGAETGAGGSSGAPGVPTLPAVPLDPAGLVPCPAFPPSADPKCGATDKKRSVGTGNSFPETIQGGFVDEANKRVVIAVSGIFTPGKKLAAVFTVDLATGNRTVISGEIVDPAEGPKTIGEGPELTGNYMSIAAGPDGWYAATDDGIFKIDPANGKRTLAVNLKVPPFNTGVCSAGGLTIAPSGKMYRVFHNIGDGVVEITPGSTPTCREVTNNKTNGAGSGAKPQDPLAPFFFAGKVWTPDRLGGALFTVDPATGAGLKVTAQRGEPGSGDSCLGTNGVSANASIFWTFNTDPSTGDDCAASTYPPIVAVDPTTGQRTGIKTNAEGPRDYLTAVFALPGQTRKVLFASKNALYIYDADRSLTNIFSY